MEIDKRLLVKISQLEQYIQKFESLVPQNEEEYNLSEVSRYATERLLQITIECTLDICALLIKTLHLGPPKSEDQILDLSGTYLNIIPKVKEMKRFRNRLVHKYDDLNDSMIFNFATEDVTDFQDFLNEAKNLLEDQEKE